eukprot:4802017-Pyramimonas_sp.AAC.1
MSWGSRIRTQLNEWRRQQDGLPGGHMSWSCFGREAGAPICCPENSRESDIQQIARATWARTSPP